MDNDFFTPGTEVRVNKELDYRPIMVVKSPERNTFFNKEESKGNFKGLKCFWFDSEFRYCEAVFNTKDLEFYKGGEY